MKKYLLLFFVLSSWHLLAQKKGSNSVHFGLYGPYFTQPGLNVGASLDLKFWEVQTSTGGNRLNSIFVSPQTGFFVRPGIHSNYILSADFGYKRQNKNRRVYVATGLGLAYLLRNQTLGTTIDLSNGNTTNKDKEWRSFFLPSVNIEFGKNSQKKAGWYVKSSYGRAFSSRFENAGFFALEFGIRVKIIKATKSTAKSI